MGDVRIVGPIDWLFGTSKWSMRLIFLGNPKAVYGQQFYQALVKLPRQKKVSLFLGIHLTLSIC